MYIESDWYAGGIPGNMVCGSHVYLDSSYGFSAFFSEAEEAMHIGEATGCYDRATFITGSRGRIRVGKFCILNGTTLISHDSIVIGDHCMLAWGSAITDSWFTAGPESLALRRRWLWQVAADPNRRLPPFGEPRAVVLEDNSWVGFDAVVLPGVRLGRGCIVGSKSVVWEDVPPYAVVAGNPARIIHYLEADDTPENREKVMATLMTPGSSAPSESGKAS